MAVITWYNGSSQLVKWMLYADGQWSGGSLSPAKNKSLDETGAPLVIGFSLSNFTGSVFSTIHGLPPIIRAGLAAGDVVFKGNAPVTKSPKKPTKRRAK